MGKPGLLVLLRVALARAGDPKKGVAMQAYMKSTMPYRGVQTPAQRAITHRLFAMHRLETAADWRAMCLRIWRDAKYREERYAAIDLTGFKYYRQWQTLDTLPMYEEMIVTGAWWDYVDQIASRRLGPLLRQNPSRMRNKMLQWSRSRNLWKRRSAILCQLSFKSETDLDLLYAAIEPSLASKEFFLQKAIGWALRQYAWTDPLEVRRYVRANAHRLSALSRREALKNIQ